MNLIKKNPAGDQTLRGFQKFFKYIFVWGNNLKMEKPKEMMLFFNLTETLQS